MGTKKKTTRKTAPKKKVFPNWRAVGSNGYTGTYDAWHSKAAPSSRELVNAYEDISYACITLIASKCAVVPIRLYTKNTGKLSYNTQKVSLRRKQHVQAQQRAATQFNEVLSHPLLNLLYRVNPFHNLMDLIELTEIYLLSEGNAYWLLELDGSGKPYEIYLLPSQYITPLPDANNIIKGYEYNNGTTELTYSPDEIVHFKMNNPRDPYLVGYSPMRAAWQRVQIGWKELGYLDSTLSNQARIDGVLQVRDPINPLEAEHLSKDFANRFRRDGAGGILTTDGTIDFKPINWAPTDVAQLQLYQTIKNSISNIFLVPPDIWELGESNRATADAALYSLAVNCIKPKILHFVEKINERLVPYFGEELFFCADEVVPEDRDFKLKETETLLKYGVVERNEIREAYGYEPKAWGADPLVPSGMLPVPEKPDGVLGMSPMPTGQGQGQGLPAQGDGSQPTTAPEATALRATVGGSEQIMAMQIAVAAGQMSREAAIANARLVFGYSADEAAQLFPIADVPKTPLPAPVQPAQPLAEPPQTGKRFPDYKAYPLENPEPLEKVLKLFFQKQEEEVLSKAKAFKANSPAWFDLDKWTEELTKDCLPVMQLYYDQQARATVSRLGLSPDMFSVTQPKLKEAIEQHTFVFAQSTNETTSLELGDALDKLKQELTEGLVQGDYKQLLTDRVRSVFDTASAQRAVTIAQTEASRAQNSAMMIVGDASDVVVGYRWILSDDACPECNELVASKPTIKKGEHFREGQGVYGTIDSPPAHPKCRCSMTEIVEV